MYRDFGTAMITVRKAWKTPSGVITDGRSKNAVPVRIVALDGVDYLLGPRVDVQSICTALVSRCSPRKTDAGA